MIMLLTDETCVWVNVFRVAVLALQVFRDTLTSLLNLQCEFMPKSHVASTFFEHILTKKVDSCPGEGLMWKKFMRMASRP